jgi:hypothetical protein
VSYLVGGGGLVHLPERPREQGGRERRERREREEEKTISQELGEGSCTHERFSARVHMRPIIETPEAQSNLTFLLQILHVSPALALDRVYAQFGDNRRRFFWLFVISTSVQPA